MPKERFSKKALAAFIAARRAELEQEHRFDPGNGWAQVKGKGEAANRAYGEYDALHRIADYFDLSDVAESIVVDVSIPVESDMARRAKQRPSNYARLSARDQWEIDKELGILDWDGS